MLLVVLTAVAIFKMMFRLAIGAVIVGVVLVMFFGFTPEKVMELGKKAVSTANTLLSDTIEPILLDELKDASYKENPDGTYEISTKSIKIIGVKGEPKATLYYKDKEIEIDMTQYSELIQKYIREYEAPYDDKAKTA